MQLNDYLNTVEKAERLAERMGIPSVLLSQWRHGVRPVPVDKCVLIEKLTGGLVTRKELRPHDYAKYWPELDEKQQCA